MCSATDIIATAATGGAYAAYKASAAAAQFAVDQIFPAPEVPKLPPLEQPPLPPDLSDELVKRAAALQRMRQAMGQGIGSTYLTGPLGLTTPAPTSVPGLGGA